MMRVLALYPIEKEIVNDCSIVHVSVPRFISGHFSFHFLIHCGLCSVDILKCFGLIFAMKIPYNTYKDLLYFSDEVFILYLRCQCVVYNADLLLQLFYY